MSSSKPAGSIHDFTVKDAGGNDVDLSIYKGKVLLIVNVASQCGLTNSNYKELTQLYETYKDKVDESPINGGHAAAADGIGPKRLSHACQCDKDDMCTQG